MALGKGESLHGVRVRTLLPEAPQDVLMGKLAQTMELVALYAPRSLRQLQRCSGILVFGDEGPIGQWHREARVVKLAEKFVAADDTEPAHVAATIVHEAAHSRLEDAGVRYTADRRKRIEAICVRAEARFADRVPGGRELSNYYRRSAARILADSDDRWSNESFRRRDIQALVALETPRWVLRAIGVSSEEVAASKKDQAGAHDV